MTRTLYRVRIGTAYLTRRTVTGPLEAVMNPELAYTFDTLEDAAQARDHYVATASPDCEVAVEKI